MIGRCPNRDTQLAHGQSVCRCVMVPKLFALSLVLICFPETLAEAQPYPGRWPPPGWTEHPEVVYPSGYRRTVQAVPTVQRIYMWPQYWTDVPYPVKTRNMEHDYGTMDYTDGVMSYDDGIIVYDECIPPNPVPYNDPMLAPHMIPHAAPDQSEVAPSDPQSEPPTLEPDDTTSLHQQIDPFKPQQNSASPASRGAMSGQKRPDPRYAWPVRSLEQRQTFRVLDPAPREASLPQLMLTPPIIDEQPTMELVPHSDWSHLPPTGQQPMRPQQLRGTEPRVESFGEILERASVPRHAQSSAPVYHLLVDDRVTRPAATPSVGSPEIRVFDLPAASSGRSEVNSHHATPQSHELRFVLPLGVEE